MMFSRRQARENRSDLSYLHLYLAVGDSVGASSSGNEGSFQVKVTESRPGEIAIAHKI